MKFFFDARYIRIDHHDGISRYSTELGNALAATYKDVTFIISDTRQLGFLPKNCQFVIIHSPTSPKEPLTSRILNKFHPDVVFSPMQTMGSAGRKFKLILTSHDMIYHHFAQPPYGLNPLIALGWRVYHATPAFDRIALNGADLVATVSHTVRAEFEAAKLTKRPIVVVPNAPQDLAAFLEGAPQVVHAKPPRDLIYMGSLMPYKNVETLIAGMEHLPDHTLHILSKAPAKRRQELEALVPKNRKVKFYNGVSDKEYAELLTNNGILVTASLAEGFGLPVVEAMALGTPVVLSDTPIFHEVATDAALYFSPLDSIDFANQVKSLDEKNVRDKFAEKGIAQAKTFSWKKSAATLLEAAKSLQ